MAVADSSAKRGPRGRHLLTALEVKSSLAPKLRDGDGLWLHRNKSGGRSWVFIYIRGGRRREMGLGAYGRGTGSVSLAEARRKADEVRAILGVGGDPFTDMEERRRRIESALPRSRTFSEVASSYMEAMKPKWRGRATEPAWKRFTDIYTASIGTCPIDQVDTAAVLKVVEPLWHSKPETASKVRERLKLVLDFAKAKGFRAGDNPAIWKGHLDKVLPPPNKLLKRHHAAAPYEDVPGIVSALRGATGVGAKALEFTILTAARSGETRGAVFGEFDLTSAVWVIPAIRMKSGVEHRVPLSDRALSIVQELAKVRQSDYVFPGSKRGSMISDMTMAKALRTAGGAGYTVHGFRSAFRDWTSDQTEHQRETAEAALSHAVGDKVERAYRRGDALSKRRLLMADWAAFVEGLANG